MPTSSPGGGVSGTGPGRLQPEIEIGLIAGYRRRARDGHLPGDSEPVDELHLILHGARPYLCLGYPALEMQEFAERWWQVGVGLVVLALVISGVLLAGGDEGGEEPDAAAEVASAPPEATTPTDETSSASGTDTGNGEGQSKDGNGPGEMGGTRWAKTVAGDLTP